MRGSGAVGVPPRCSPHDHHRQVLHHLPRSEGEDVEEPRTLSKLDLHLVREWYDKKDKELEETRGEAYITPAACTGLFPYVRTGTGLFPSDPSVSTGTGLFPSVSMGTGLFPSINVFHVSAR